MTTEPATIAARARQALHQLSAAIAETPDPRHYVTEKFLSRVRLAALLAIPPAAVSAADDKSRATESTDALILTATDPADPATTYRFSLADPRFNDTPIRLLGRCPACGGEVPHQAIWSLAHLADADRPLDLPADGTLPQALRTAFGQAAFLGDPGHRSDCSYAN